MTTEFKSLLGNSKRIIPVIALPNQDCALPLANTLSESNFYVLEITLRTQYGLAAIELLRKQKPEMVIGAGTVKTLAQLQSVIDAGAQFAVSPGIDPEMITMALQNNLPLIPGVMTPSEIMLAEKLGLTTVKLFPANLAGGTEFIRSMASVFPNMAFFPTGGITEDNVNEFLELNNVVCAGGTWLTPNTLLENGDWTRIHEIVMRC